MSRWDTYQPFDPVPPTGDTIMEESWLLCLDEFMVRTKFQDVPVPGGFMFVFVGRGCLILPLEKVITHAKLSFMHTVYYGTAPTSFNNIWQTQAQRHPELNLRNATDIYVPFPSIDLFKRMPVYSLPTVWNSHDIIRYYANRTTFSIALHELLHTIEVQEED
jgi:hypothetical protein